MLAGAGNMALTMYGTRRLLERRNVGFFVLSSFLRICVFAILPVVLALRVPSFLTIACYFAGFFTPLALYGILLGRAFRRKI